MTKLNLLCECITASDEAKVHKPATMNECMRIININLKNSKYNMNTVPLYLLKKYRCLLSVSIINLIDDHFVQEYFQNV